MAGVLTDVVLHDLFCRDSAAIDGLSVDELKDDMLGFNHGISPMWDRRMWLVSRTPRALPMTIHDFVPRTCDRHHYHRQNFVRPTTQF